MDVPSRAAMGVLAAGIRSRNGHIREEVAFSVRAATNGMSQLTQERDEAIRDVQTLRATHEALCKHFKGSDQKEARLQTSLHQL